MSEISYLVPTEKRDAFTNEIIRLIPEKYKLGHNYTPTWDSHSLFPSFDSTFIASLPNEYHLIIQNAYKRIVVDQR